MTVLSRSVNSASIVPMQNSYNLHKLVSRLANSFLPQAVRNKSFFVNDIPDALYVSNNQQLAASVLSGLISSVAANAKDSCIRITAKVYSNIILVHVKDCSSHHYSSVENGIKQLQPLAEKMGGFVNVTSHRFNVTTFAFSFPNMPVAA